MNRNLPPPTETAPNALEADFALWSQQLDQLEAAAPTLTGTNEFPEWWYEESAAQLRNGIKPQLLEDGTDLKYVPEYFDLYSREMLIRGAISGHEMPEPLEQVTYNLGEDLVGKAFAAEPEDGSLHGALMDFIEEKVSTLDYMAPELHVLKEAYDRETITDLLGVKGTEYNDRLHKSLINIGPIRRMRYEDQKRGEDDKWQVTQDASQLWMSKAIEVVSGMPVAEAMDYAYAASRRADDEAILAIIKAFDHFGVERIRQIAKSTGIHGLDGYSIEQLERMEDFSTDPDTLAQNLAGHDVNVVLINRFGDHNGVLGSVATDFDDKNGRTLFFEINTMDDIYRRMIHLNRAGVKPSSVVLAAHSAPGQFMVSDDRERGAKKRDIASIAGRRLIKMVNDNGELDPGDRGFSMHGMKGLARLVEDYMQPSRAIDDFEGDKGRKKIIFQACHAASEEKSGDFDEEGNKIPLGIESVISQLGKDLVASGTKSQIDIYGASAGIQMESTSLGIKYTGQPNGFGEGRTAQHAERIRIENGQITKKVVEEILLRKVS